MSSTNESSPFYEEDDSNLELIRGENNAWEYSVQSVGDSRVALFFSLVRGCNKSKIEDLMNNCLSTVSELSHEKKSEMIADLFILTFQTRDCRGVGKGEKDLFYHMLLHLFQIYPDTVLKLLDLFKDYGYYKDFYKILEIEEVSCKPEYHLLRNKMIDYIANQLILDENHLNANRISEISLCAKYAPREGKHFAIGKNEFIYKQLIEKIYPSANQSYKQNRKQYRQLINKLTIALDIPEVKMCSKRYSELDFSKVPSICTNKFMKAFLNEKLNKKNSKSNNEMDETITLDRYPYDQDRIQCRTNLTNAALNNKVKGTQLHPHEIVQTLYNKNRKKISSLQKEILNTQWNDMRQTLVNKLNQVNTSSTTAATSLLSNKSINIGKLIPLSDVSGSMEGIPMLVSIGLGILISELSHPVFRNHVLTFETDTKWINLSKCNKIADKVDVLKKASWGGSTNLQKAFELIINVIKLHKLPMDDIPDLIIFSDMQFDQCTADFNTQFDIIKHMFHDVGIEICGKPYSTPKIIFWNLRSDTVGFPVQSSEVNVQMLSGFSPSLLKFILDNENIDDINTTNDVQSDTNSNDNEIVKDRCNRNVITPYQTLRKVLDDERYYPIRVILNESIEHDLVHYHFQIPVTTSTTSTNDII